MLALQSVHLEVTLDPAGGLLGGSTTANGRADLDVGHTSAHVTAGVSDVSIKPVEITVKDGVWYIDTGGGVQKQGGGMLPMPAGDDLKTAVTSFATDARLQVTGSDVACASAVCHELVGTAPPALVWERFAPLIRAFMAVPDQLPGDLPPARITIDVAATTGEPMKVIVDVTYAGKPIRLVVDASGFDQPVTITAPAG